MPGRVGVLERLTVGELLDALAERTPAPGGGTAAATAGALAAALVEMAARFTLAREASADVHTRTALVLERARELLDRLLALGEIELHAYEPVLEALRLPREDPDRSRRVAAARSAAAQSPFEIVAATAELAGLAAELAHTGNPNLEGDALTACALAEAACSAATRLVEINLPEEEGDPRVAQAQELARRAQELARQAQELARQARELARQARGARGG